MKQLDFELAVGDTDLDRLRPILDRAIDAHFADGFLRHRWEGDVLRLSGPGAKGSVVHEAGRLRLTARLGPPASFVGGVIRRKIQAALDDVEAAIKRRA